MRRVTLRVLVFTSVPLALTVLTDLLLWIFYQGAQPAEKLNEIILLHGVFYLAILVCWSH